MLSWEVVLATGRSDRASDQGRPSPGWLPSLFLKAQCAMDGLHFPRPCSLSGRRLRSAPMVLGRASGAGGSLGLSLVPVVVWPDGQGR